MNFKERHEKSQGPIEFNELKPAIRISNLKLPKKEILDRLKERGISLMKIPFLKDGYFANADFSLGSTIEYLQGHYYLQEAASQIPVEILQPNSSDNVLDMCASPGSKTTQLANLMRNKGTVVALDISTPRINKLSNNLERMGIKNTIVYKMDARFAEFNEEFDKILLDAPCSGNYLIEKNWYDKRNLDDIKACARTQKELITNAASLLKKGGELVYSTCSLEPEENETIIEWALSNLPLKLQKINFPIGESGISKNAELKKSLRLWPNKTQTQGFFVAKLKKD